MTKQKPIRVETCNLLRFALYKASEHLFSLSTIFGKSREKIQPIKIAISGLNSQLALARAKWHNLVFEQFGLNKVIFWLNSSVPSSFSSLENFTSYCIEFLQFL